MTFSVIIIILTTAFFIYPSFIETKQKYSYSLNITTKPYINYSVDISIPEGWPDFLTYKEKQTGEIYDVQQSSINGQPSINLSGRGMIMISFVMETSTEHSISFVKNWNVNGTLVYIQRSNNDSLELKMECVHYNTSRWDFGYSIQGTISRDGWQYVSMKLKES